MKPPPGEPTVTVWRNKLSHRCALLYHGRQWRIKPDKNGYRRLINLRHVHLWTSHSPVNGGEIINIQWPPEGGWHFVEPYNADGTPFPLGETIPLQDYQRGEPPA